MRVSINLSQEMLQRVDQEAKRIGTSRGAMLTTWIGEKVSSLDQARNMYQGLVQAMNEKIEQIAKDKFESKDPSELLKSLKDAGIFDEQLSLLGKESK